MISRKIIPVQPSSLGWVTARRSIVAVFDTTGDGVLVEVAFAHDPFDSTQAQLQYAQYGQIYVEIHE